MSGKPVQEIMNFCYQIALWTVLCLIVIDWWHHYQWQATPGEKSRVSHPTIEFLTEP